MNMLLNIHRGEGTIEHDPQEAGGAARSQPRVPWVPQAY